MSLADIPPMLPPDVNTAVQAVALDRANQNDDTENAAKLVEAAQKAVGDGALSKDGATALLAAYGVTYSDPPAAPPPTDPPPA